MVKEMKRQKWKTGYTQSLILLVVLVFYLYVDYYDWFPKQTIVIPDEGGGIGDDIIIGHLTKNMIYKYLGSFAQLFFFTVQTFYLLVILLAVHAWKNNSKTELWINFGKAYAGLVATLFVLMIMPTIPFSQLPITFVAETFFHIVIPCLYWWFTRKVEFTRNKKNIQYFVIFPLVYYVVNWMLHIFSGFRAWTYPFFNYTDPLTAGFGLHIIIMFNIIIFILLVSVFLLTWYTYEKMYGKKWKRKIFTFWKNKKAQ